MHADTLARSLRDLTDDDLLDRAFEPEFMRERTPLEVELLWRLAAAVHAVELERTGQRRMLAALWPETAQEQGRPVGKWPSWRRFVG